MNYKNVMLFGRNVYSFIYQYFELVLPLRKDKDFLYKKENFLFEDFGMLTLKPIFDYDKTVPVNVLDFDMEKFFDFFIDKVNESNVVQVYFQGFEFDKKDLFKNLEIKEILVSNKSKPLYKIYLKIKEKLVTFLTYFLNENILSKNINKAHLNDISKDYILEKFDSILDDFFYL